MTIKEVSTKYNISADTIRYYEKIGLLPPIPRLASGIRFFDDQSCRWINLMICMRKAGVQIETLTEYVSLYQQGDTTLDAREDLLIAQRNKLLSKVEEIQHSISLLNTKIDNYQKGLMFEKDREERLNKMAGLQN